MWLDIFHKEMKNLDYEARDLYSLANSFSEVGMETTADRLRDIASHLSEIKEKLVGAQGKKINEEIKWSQQNSSNILKAALAGIKVAKKK